MSRGFPAATILFSNKTRDQQARSIELEGVKFHVYLTNCCVISGMRAAGERHGRCDVVCLLTISLLAKELRKCAVYEYLMKIRFMFLKSDHVFRLPRYIIVKDNFCYYETIPNKFKPFSII